MRGTTRWRTGQRAVAEEQDERRGLSREMGDAHMREEKKEQRAADSLGAGSSRGWTARAGAPRCLWELGRPPRMPPALNSGFHPAQCKEMTAHEHSGTCQRLGQHPRRHPCPELH